MDNVFQLRPSPERLLALAAAAAQAGRLEEAEASCLQAVELAPDLVEAWVQLGRVRERGGRPNEAEAAYHRALELDQTHSAAYHGLATVYGAQGKPRMRRFCLGWLVMLDPDNPDARFDLALTLEELGDAWAAKKHWRAFLRLCPAGAAADTARARLAE